MENVSGVDNISHTASGNNSNVPKHVPMANLVVPVTMFALGVLGNTLALFILWRSRRQNVNSVFYRLVIGLVVTDLFGILVTTPITIAVYINNRQWLGGSTLCSFFSFMMIFSGLATVFIIGILTVERYIAILHPYLYEKYARPPRVKWAMCLAWMLAALVSSLPLVKLGTNVLHYPGTWCFFDFYSHATPDRAFSFLYAALGLLVIVFTVITNVAVMAELYRMRRITKTTGKSRDGHTRSITSEVQMILFVVCVTLVFASCYTPLMVRVIINASNVLPQDKVTDLVVIRLASLNQIFDPWVYLLLQRRIVKLLYYMLQCKSVPPRQMSLQKFRSSVKSDAYSSSKQMSMSKVRPSVSSYTLTSSNPMSSAEIKPKCISNSEDPVILQQ